MKILYANKFFFPKGGAEISLFLLERLLCEMGHEAVHFSMQDERNNPSPWSDYFVSNVNYNGGAAHGRLKAAARMFWSREVTRKVRLLVKETKPDVAILNNVYHQLGPSLLSALDRLGVPMIMFARDGKLVCPAYTMLRERRPCELCSGGRFYQAARHGCGGSISRGALLALESYWQHDIFKSWPKLKAIVSPSEFLANKMRDMGLQQEIVVHRNVVPRVAPAEKSVERQTVGFVGRLSQEKGIDVLIHAASCCPELEFRIVGEGPEEQHVRHIVKATGTTNVTLLGAMTAAQLQAEMRTWRLGVCPSIWYENCPRVVLEALALGIPVIGADIGGIPELVSNAGLLVEPGNSARLSEAIKELWNDPERCDALGRNGIEFVREHCDEARYAQRMQDLLQEVVSSTRTVQH